MKKTFIYSFCGLFITSAAVARTLYLDLGPYTQCGGWCLVNPGNGNCCPSESIVTKLNVSSDSSTKTVEGVYLDGVKLADDDGNVLPLSSDQIAAIRASYDSQSGTVAQMVNKEFDKGTLFLSLVQGNNGIIDVAESPTPERGDSACDSVEIHLINCTGYNTGYSGQTCNTPSSCNNYCIHNTSQDQVIYYKPNVGYFADAGMTQQYQDATHTSIIRKLQAPTNTGYIFRGWFTSFFRTSIRDESSYIENYPPYRTAGHAYYISWKNNDMTELYLREPNWTIGGNCKLYLFSGWAKKCDDTDHCDVTITGKEEYDEHPEYCLKTPDGLCGLWYPGSVEYTKKGICPTGSDWKSSGSRDVTLSFSQYGPVTQKINTAYIGCESTTPAAPTKIRLKYHANGGVIEVDTCTIGNSVQITLKTQLQGQVVEAFAYNQDGEMVFEAGEKVNCEVGNSGFATDEVDDEFYVVHLYPVSAPSQPTLKIKYTVTLPEESTKGEGGFIISPTCTNTQTCTEGMPVTLKSKLDCPTGEVSISKWTKADGGDISGFNATCSTSALGEAANGTITLTGAIVGGTNSFVCQRTGFTAPANGKVEYNSQSGETCNYTVSCDQGYTMAPSNGTVTCSGESGCTVAKLNQQFANYSCTPTFSCPTEGFNLTGRLTASLKTSNSGTQTCKYSVSCTDDYVVSPTTDYTCTGSTNCTVAKISAAINSQYSCAAPTPTFACPAVNTDLQTPSGAVLTRTNQNVNAQTCTYSVSCDSSHAFPTGNNPVTISCSGTTGSNGCTASALQTRINSEAQNCLLKLSAGDCTAEFAEGDDAQAGTITGTLINNNTGCRFIASCPIAYCNPGNLGASYCGNSDFECTNAEDCLELVNKFATVSCSTNNFTCPGVSDLPQPNHASLEFISKDGDSCEYRQKCDREYKLSNGLSIALPECIGTECFDNNYAYFTNFYTQHQCALACPNASEFLSNPMVGITNVNTSNIYNCKYGVQCESSDYDLLYKGSPVQSTPFTQTCDMTDDGCEYSLFNNFTCKLSCPSLIESSNNQIIAALLSSSSSNEDNCVYMVGCKYEFMTLTGTPNPISVARTGTAQTIINTVIGLLNENYSCN